MPRFGHFYAHGQLVIFELTFVVDGSRPLYVATLSADPRMTVRARRPDVAALELQALVSRLAPIARQHVA